MGKTTIPPEPWERQKGENSKRFEAFRTFRDMPNRSISQVARELSKSRQLIQRWAGEDNWHDRVAAWDAEQDRVARQAQLDEIKAMRKRHADLANALLVKAAKALQRIPDDEIKAGDVSRMVETGAKLERISRGDAGEVVEERDGGPAPSIVQFYIPDNHRDGNSEEADEEETP